MDESQKPHLRREKSNHQRIQTIYIKFKNAKLSNTLFRNKNICNKTGEFFF